MVDALAYFIHTLFSNIRIVFLIRSLSVYIQGLTKNSIFRLIS